MQADRFDRLSQAVGRATSRRRALAVLAGGAAAAFAAPYLVGRSATAWGDEAERAASAALIQCQPHNFPTLNSCEEIGLYIRQCGIVCADGFRKEGADGCTSSQVTFSFVDRSIFVHLERRPDGTVCASQAVTAVFGLEDLVSVTLRPTLSGTFCCQGECDEMVRQYVAGIEAHEAIHRLRRHEMIARANVEWTNRVETACGATEDEAIQALNDALPGRLLAAAEGLNAAMQSDPEPPISPRPDCSKCQPKRPHTRCENGTCVTWCLGNVCPTAPGFGGCCPPEFPHCCEASCCPHPWSVCCGGGTDACCRWPDFPICAIHPTQGIICRRAQSQLSEFSEEGVDYIPAAVPGRGK